MVIDETLPIGIIANTAAILGTTLGKQQPDIHRRSCVVFSRRIRILLIGSTKNSESRPVYAGRLSVSKNLRTAVRFK